MNARTFGPDVNRWKELCDSNEVLSFAVFCQVMNNFRLHFTKGALCMGIYCKNPAYAKCIEVNSDFRKLAYLLRGRKNRHSDNYLKKLYKAYKMMRSYAASNWEMFE